MTNHRLAAAAVLLVLGGAFVAAAIGVASATDEPAFCVSSCHEMRPYHAAWAQGPHANVSCVECHVDPGPVSRVTHKVVAMREVWSHLTTQPAFPMANPSAIPDSRCVRCHANPRPADPNFDHAAHSRGRSCQICHAAAGHSVTAESLKAAGIFNASGTAESVLQTSFAVVDGGAANLKGHVPVECARCHDMAATGCARCHTPRHGEDGSTGRSRPCSTCHKTGARFVFTHPDSRTDCTACHATPSSEHEFEGTCSTCHRTGVSFDFRHPSSKKCVSCHARPSGHRGGACTSCHRTGVTWRFAHPTRSDCASCHSRPSGHYSGACASCHSPGRSWGSASFRHPGVPGGEHSYRSFRCKACHPGGYGSYSCRTCHDGEGGEDDD